MSSNSRILTPLGIRSTLARRAFNDTRLKGGATNSGYAAQRSIIYIERRLRGGSHPPYDKIYNELRVVSGNYWHISNANGTLP
jgi:hypothetical protein